MRGTVLYGPRDVRFEERDTPTINKPTDAIIRIAATCVCGSDLWPYRGISPIAEATPMGHECYLRASRWADQRNDRRGLPDKVPRQPLSSAR
jgi:threonine dehydrogenase-like Zn-dependent dehydrogenase